MLGQVPCYHACNIILMQNEHSLSQLLGLHVKDVLVRGTDL